MDQTVVKSNARGVAKILAMVAVACLWTNSAAMGQSHDAGQRTVIRATQWVAPDGSLQPDAIVVIENGRLKQVGGEPPRGVRVLEFEGVLSPGLVDAYGALATHGPVSENTRAVETDAQATNVFDRHSQDIRKAIAAGVTTFAIAPGDEDLISGQFAICVARPDATQAELLVEQGPLKLSLSPAVYKMDREPTSRGGAIGMLRRILAAGAAVDAEGPVSAFVSGRRTGIIAAPLAADVLAVLGLKKDYAFDAVIVHEKDARDVAELLASAAMPVIVGPLGLDASRRTATAAGVYERAGVEISIAGGFPWASADSLRLGANIAVGGGLSLPAARRAITISPARALGVADQVGAIEAGKRADLVVFSGDPLDMRSRVLAVFTGGKQVSER